MPHGCRVTLIDRGEAMLFTSTDADLVIERRLHARVNASVWRRSVQQHSNQRTNQQQRRNI